MDPATSVSNDLSSENRRLRGQLKTFIDEARVNEEKMRRFDQFELALLGAASLGELVQLLLYQSTRHFGLDHVTLTLVDPEYEFTRLLQDSPVRPASTPELIIERDSTNLIALYGERLTPRLGEFRELHHTLLFPDKAARPNCVAALPLVRQQRLFGSLNLGSLDAERYRRGSGTEFLHRLALVVAVCLENGLNQERVRQLGLTDPLTQVKNRRYFDQRLHEELAAACRYPEPLVCIFLDVDHFKRINDTLGHQAGDAVLQQLAGVMAGQLRPNDILCRYGGEEFVVLLPNTPLEVAHEITQRIRQLVAARHFRLDHGATTRATISIGIAALARQQRLDVAATATTLLAAADAAVYRAKENGRNRIELAPLIDRHTLARAMPA